jgi:hypothetical protein
MADEPQAETKEAYLARRAALSLERALKDATARATNPNAEYPYKQMRNYVYARPIT